MISVNKCSAHESVTGVFLPFSRALLLRNSDITIPVGAVVAVSNRTLVQRSCPLRTAVHTLGNDWAVGTKVGDGRDSVGGIATRIVPDRLGIAIEG